MRKGVLSLKVKNWLEPQLFWNLSHGFLSFDEVAFINEIDLEELNDDMAIRAV
jgi:hypothetical protein